MKTLEINIDEIKRFPTVTNPIKADDLHTPQAYAYTLRRDIVTDCNDRQRAELVELLEGKDTAEGVTFNNTQRNRDRLHLWQNRESRKERAAILGDGWEYISGLNHGTEPGDLITCIDGTRGRVTKADEGSCVIEFETENGQRLSVAGYFRYTPSAKSETADELPDWLHVGTRFCLLDFVTGKPTAVRYTCAAIDYENKTVTIPEARDRFRNGSTVYRWDAFHWSTFAPVSEGEGEFRENGII